VARKYGELCVVAMLRFGIAMMADVDLSLRPLASRFANG
jgi:hypothetical protein